MPFKLSRQERSRCLIAQARCPSSTAGAQRDFPSALSLGIQKGTNFAGVEEGKRSTISFALCFSSPFLSLFSAPLFFPFVCALLSLSVSFFVSLLYTSLCVSFLCISCLHLQRIPIVKAAGFSFSHFLSCLHLLLGSSSDLSSPRWHRSYPFRMDGIGLGRVQIGLF